MKGITLKAYILNISPLYDQEKYQKAYKILKENDQNKIDSYKQLADKIRSLGSRLLISYALKLEGVKDYEIIYGMQGKPLLKDREIYFNVSHSGDYVVLAIDQKPIGVDVQRMPIYKNMKLANRFFHETEIATLKKAPLEEQAKLFYYMFSIKESCLKCDGRGISEGLDTLLVDESLNFAVDLKKNQKYQLTIREIEKDYVLTISQPMEVE